MDKFEKAKQILQKLGFTKKATEKKMNESDWKAFSEEYSKTFGLAFEDETVGAEVGAEGAQGAAASDNSKLNLSAEMQTEILAALGELGDEKTEAPQTVGEAMSSFVAAMNAAAATIKQLGEKQEDANPTIIKGAAGTSNDLAIVLGHTPHSATHLFGISGPFFAKEKWWNAITANRTLGDSQHTTEEVTDFRASFNEYARSLKARVNHLAESGQMAVLDYDKMIAGSASIDYSSVSNELGAAYMVRRQDMLIAYLRTLPSVAAIFPVRSNVQDKEAVVNAFFSEFSQGYVAGDVFKGGVKVTPEVYKVDDVMFKHMFSNLKDLEKQYIGYINKEGSNPMKWTFIEWLLSNIYTVLSNEQQRRRVIGTRVPVRTGVDNPSLLAADGVLTAILKLIEQRKVQPFTDSKTYARETILEMFEDMWEKVIQVLPSAAGFRMYANAKHRSWYLQAYREKYGKDGDFTGTKDTVSDLSPENIIWVPNMDMGDYFVWITIPGNIENYELTPGEMFAVYFEQRLESLITASWWKEGSGVQMSGLKCATDAELAATGRKFQYIFTNYPVSKIAIDATIADGSVNTMFETSSNTKATVLTDITNASSERVYKIICGDVTNATSITKEDNFSKIATTWKPTAVGDFIKVYAELAATDQTIDGKTVSVTAPTGKFLELERRVTA